MSDISKVYAPGKEPGFVSGSTTANGAGCGVPEQSGKEKASLNNQHVSHNYGDLAK